MPAEKRGSHSTEQGAIGGKKESPVPLCYNPSMTTRKLISFDWALKKLLRSKANYSILEGFLSELLRDDIRILELLDSESNKDDACDKFNRVDLKIAYQRYLDDLSYQASMVQSSYGIGVVEGNSRVPDRGGDADTSSVCNRPQGGAKKMPHAGCPAL